MTKYRIVERINGLHETTFHLEYDGFFGWREVQYSAGMEYSEPHYHKTEDSARKERYRLLEEEKQEKLRYTIISTKIME